jgi:hypothetical protein
MHNISRNQAIIVDYFEIFEQKSNLLMILSLDKSFLMHYIMHTISQENFL